LIIKVLSILSFWSELIPEENGKEVHLLSIRSRIPGSPQSTTYYWQRPFLVAYIDNSGNWNKLFPEFSNGTILKNIALIKRIVHNKITHLENLTYFAGESLSRGGK
jgi:hypothetical protein